MSPTTYMFDFGFGTKLNQNGIPRWCQNGSKMESKSGPTLDPFQNVTIIQKGGKIITWYLLNIHVFIISSLKSRRRASSRLIRVASLRSCEMAIRARACLLKSFAENGHGMRVHTSYNAATAIEKIKVVVDPTISEIAPHQRAVLFTLLDLLIEKVGTCVTTDRGHVHSSGQTTSEFYLKHPRIAADSVHVDTPDSISPSPRSDGDQPPEFGEGSQRGAHESANPNQRNNRKEPPSNADSSSGKKPRVHGFAPSSDAANLDDSALNTSCSTVEYYEINSDESASDDGSEIANENQYASVDALCQTEDTIPPDASAKLLVSPSHIFDAAMEASMCRITAAFSKLRSAMGHIDERADAPVEAVPPEAVLMVSTPNEDIDSCSEVFLSVRVKLVCFQYAFAEAMELMDAGWSAANVAEGVVFDLPEDDDHEDCMRLTNVYMFLALRATIETYTPFCTSAAHISEGEAVDAIKDHLFNLKCPPDYQNEVVSSVRNKFLLSKTIPFLDFIAKQAGDVDSRASFWSDGVVLEQ